VKLIEAFPIQIFQGVDLLVLPLHCFDESIEDLSELLRVLLNDIEALLTVLPVLADMSRSTSMLIVMIVVKLVVSEFIGVCHETNIIRNVLLLSEILDVKTEVNDYLLALGTVKKGHQEVSCDLIDNTTGNTEN
jgi:hypothetical protein